MPRGFILESYPVKSPDGSRVAQDIADRFAAKLKFELLPGYECSESNASIRQVKNYIQIETPTLTTTPGPGIQLLVWFQIEANDVGYTLKLYAIEEWLGLRKAKEHSHFSVQEQDGRLRDVSTAELIAQNAGNTAINTFLSTAPLKDVYNDRYFSQAVAQSARELKSLIMQLWFEATNESQTRKPYQRTNTTAQSGSPQAFENSSSNKGDAVTSAKSILLFARTAVVAVVSGVAASCLIGIALMGLLFSFIPMPVAIIFWCVIVLCIIVFNRLQFVKQKAEIEQMTQGEPFAASAYLQQSLTRISPGMTVIAFWLGILGTPIGSIIAASAWRKTCSRAVSALKFLSAPSQQNTPLGIPNREESAERDQEPVPPTSAASPQPFSPSANWKCTICGEMNLGGATMCLECGKKRAEPAT